MPDYDLIHLGSRAFEQFFLALARKELCPRVSVFGDGRDGGEATFDGQLNRSATVAATARNQQPRNGFVVVQSEYMVKPTAEPKANTVRLPKAKCGRN